jgi:hypothetical protein
MSFITKEYYEKEYLGKTISREDFEQLAELASDDVDGMTHGRINKKGFENFNADTQRRIKKATCVMLENLITIKDLSDGGNGVIKTSESVGGYSYSIERESIDKMVDAFSERARKYLLPTGLLYAGVGDANYKQEIKAGQNNII